MPFKDKMDPKKEALNQANKHLVMMGYHVSIGFFKRLIELGIFVWLIIMAATLLRNVTWIGVDDSDLDTWNRSGVKVITDYKQGVQYLLSPEGGLTVRLDVNGEPMVNKNE